MIALLMRRPEDAVRDRRLDDQNHRVDEVSKRVNRITDTQRRAVEEFEALARLRGRKWD